jgi:hypothetical protein
VPSDTQDFIVLLWSTGWRFPLENYKQSVVSVLLTILEANKLAERSAILQWQNLEVLTTIICWSCYIDCLVGYEECHMSSTDLLQKESTIDIDTYWEFLVESLLKFAIRWKQCRLLPGGVSMQHDNAHLYSSRKRVAKMKEFLVETSHTCLTRPFAGFSNLFGILTSEFSWFSFQTDRESECALQVGCVTNEENASMVASCSWWIVGRHVWAIMWPLAL